MDQRTYRSTISSLLAGGLVLGMLVSLAIRELNSKQGVGADVWSVAVPTIAFVALILRRLWAIDPAASTRVT